jgi:hypothetical protein
MASEMEFVNYKQFVERLPVASSYANGDKSVVSNEINGPRKMPQTTAEQIAAQNALAGNVAPAFDPTKPNDEGGYAYYSGDNVSYNGKNYVFVLNHVSGPWNFSEVEQKPLCETIPLQGVGQAVQDWLDGHPEATTTVQDGSLTEQKFSDTLKLQTIKDYITPEMFGAKGDGVTDDTAAFVSCVASAVSFGKNIFLAPKTYAITPLDLTGTNGVYIQGSGRYPTKGTQLKIIGNPNNLDAALQRYSPDDTAQTWNKRFFIIRDVYINCNSQVNIGINGSYGMYIDGVWVRGAIDSGVVFENYSYPAEMRRSICDQCGKNGFVARGNMTTSYKLDHCEFNSNGEYGMLITAGSCCQFDNLIAQSNGISGVKIIKTVNDGEFLAYLTFYNLYTEANGNNNDNHVWITSETLDNTPLQKPAFIEFINSQINGNFVLDACYVMRFTGGILGQVIVNYENSLRSILFNYGDIANARGGNLVGGRIASEYLDNDRYIKKIYKCGVFSDRGNILEENFYLATIPDSNPILMDTPLSLQNNDSFKGVLVNSASSIVKILFAPRQHASINGSVDIEIVINSGSPMGKPTVPLNTTKRTIKFANIGGTGRWTSNTAYAIGNRVYVEDRYVYECVTAGTSGDTSPTQKTDGVVDGTVVWNYLHDIVNTFSFGPGQVPIGATYQFGLRVTPNADYSTSLPSVKFYAKVVFESGY